MGRLPVNLAAVERLLGRLALFLAALMALPAAVALGHGEGEAVRAFGISAGISAGLGLLLVLHRRGRSDPRDMHRREGLAAVGLSWLLVAVLGALPLHLSGVTDSWVDAFFESASAFTTTGASILSGERIDALPVSIAFWRCYAQWLGGIGIVLVFAVFFPTGGRSLFRSEATGLSRDADTERLKDFTRVVASLYISLTALCFVALLLQGLGWFDALLLAFSSVATGGMSNRGASVAAFDSFGVELTVVFAMLFASVGFLYWVSFLRRGPVRGWENLRESTEVRTFAALFAACVLVVGLRLWFWGGSNGDPGSDLPDYSSLGRALRDALFTTASLQTTAGFATADYDRWPELCRMLLMAVAFCGACAGSTSGGLKLVRAVIVARAGVRGLLAFARPRAIHQVRMDGHPLEESVVASVTGFFGLWILALVVGGVALAAMDVPEVEAFSASLSALSNIGPALGSLGPAGHWGDLPAAGKVLMALWMLLGRLEFYALAVLVLPRFWRG